MLRADKTKEKIKELEVFVKQSANSANSELLNKIVDILNEINIRLEEVERDVLPSDSFINSLDGRPSKIVSSLH